MNDMPRTNELLAKNQPEVKKNVSLKLIYEKKVSVARNDTSFDQATQIQKHVIKRMSGNFRNPGKSLARVSIKEIEFLCIPVEIF